MDIIANFVYEVKKIKRVKIHIIGDGENRQKFIDSLENARR